MNKCTHDPCNKPGRLALRTTRPTREDLRTMIYFDDRTAPKTAQPYCREHGAALVADLIQTLVAEDA